jgi:hypothetical protein
VTGLLEALVPLVIVFAIAYGSVALVITAPVAAVWAWKRHQRRKSFPRLERDRLSREHRKAWAQLSSSLRVTGEGAERKAP